MLNFIEKVDRFLREDDPNVQNRLGSSPPWHDDNYLAAGDISAQDDKPISGAQRLRDAHHGVSNPESREVSTLAALKRLAAASLLINGGIGSIVRRVVGAEKVESSPVIKRMADFELDDIQVALIDKIRKLYRLAGFKESIAIPTTQNIEAAIRDLIRDFNKITGATGKIESKTDQLVRAWYGGLLDNSPPTKEEQDIAAVLYGLSPTRSPQELRAILKDYVVQRAQDIAANIQDAEYGQRYVLAKKQLDALKKKKYAEWFILDWLSALVLLTEGERKQLESMLWTIDATGIHFISIGQDDRFDVNFLDIILPTLAGSEGEWLMEINRTTTSDTVRRIGGRLLRMPMEQISEVLGGTLQFEAQGSDRKREMFVRQVAVIKSLITEVATAARRCDQAVERMNVQRREQNMANLTPIRPNIVISLIQDPTVMEQPTMYSRRGTSFQRDIRAEITQILDGRSLPAATMELQQLTQQTNAAKQQLQVAKANIANAEGTASSRLLPRAELKSMFNLIDLLRINRISPEQRTKLLQLVRVLHLNMPSLTGDELIAYNQYQTAVLSMQVAAFESNARELARKIAVANTRNNLLSSGS